MPPSGLDSQSRCLDAEFLRVGHVACWRCGESGVVVSSPVFDNATQDVRGLWSTWSVRVLEFHSSRWGCRCGGCECGWTACECCMDGMLGGSDRACLVGSR